MVTRRNVISQKIWRIIGVDLTGGKKNVYRLGFTSDKKATAKHYGEEGWSLRHNYGKPFVQFEEVKK